MNKVIKETVYRNTGDWITLIQTKEDIKYSLKNNVTKYSSIKYKGEIISDKDTINRLFGCYPGDSCFKELNNEMNE